MRKSLMIHCTMQWKQVAFPKCLLQTCLWKLVPEILLCCTSVLIWSGKGTRGFFSGCSYSSLCVWTSAQSRGKKGDAKFVGCLLEAGECWLCWCCACKKSWLWEGRLGYVLGWAACHFWEQARKLLPGERKCMPWDKWQGRGNTYQERETGAGSPRCRNYLWSLINHSTLE